MKTWNLRLNKAILFILILGSMALAPKLFALDPQNIQAAIQKTEAIIEENIANKRIPGAAFAVVYQNKIIFMQGYGLRAVGGSDKIDVDTVFQLGSVSKPIAATLATLLESKGLLNLDDPVIAYLPRFSLNSTESRNALKIKNLLNHTSGLPRGGFNHLIESFKTHEEIVEALQTTKVNAPVGKKYDYHNAMFGLFTDITQVATHQTFPDALAFYLLKPLKMTNTSATLEDLLKNPNRAQPHTRHKKGLFAHEEYSKGYYTVAPAGGINSSVRDMATFLNAQMGAYPQFLNQHALFRMQTPYINTKNGGSSSQAVRLKDPRYGLGWRIIDYADNTLVYHGGWVKGFTNYIGFMPDQKLGIVILHNGDTKFSSRTGMKFFETALGLPEIKDNAAKPKKEKKKKASAQKTGKKKSGKKSKKKKKK